MPELESMGIYLTLSLVLMAGLYVLVAACLSVIAKKTGTPDGWMAWIPVLNLLLMCRIARKPGWMLILLLIPLVNLVILVIVWMGIAEARGKSSAMGLLILVPVLNLLLPVMLAMGPANASQPGAPVPQQPAFASCPACGSQECIQSEFCVNTGQRIRTAAPLSSAVPAGAAPAEVKPGIAAKVILGVVVAIGVLFFGYGLLNTVGRFLGGSTPGASSRSSAGERKSGKLSEFPVDTAGSNGARPTSVITTTGSGGSTAKLPAGWAPRGLNQTAMRGVTGMTSANYQARPSDPPVGVHVMDTTGRIADELARQVAASYPDAQMTGMRLESAKGEEYTGYRVRTADSTTYVFDKANEPVTVMIHASDASVAAIADRLASNIGNGGGLAEEPAIAEAVASATVSVAVPGLTLDESMSYSGANVEASVDQLKSQLGRLDAETSQLIDQAKRFIPPQLTTAVYRDGAGNKYQVVLGRYGSSWKTWGLWQLLRGTAALGQLRSVAINGGDALADISGREQRVFFRRGGCLGMVAGPVESSGHILRIAQAVPQ